MKAIILAGGKGTRLHPYTTLFPKPLLPIGNVPILEIIIKQLKKAGFSDITLAVSYLAELIHAYFGKGEKLGIKLNYSREDKPLGTAAPLTLIESLKDTFLVMNGDVLTTLNFRDLVEFHQKHKPIVTIATALKTINIDFGIVKANEENEVITYVEKPEMKYLVSMGIYIFEPTILKYIKKGKYLDIPDLINKLLKNRERVKNYVSDDYWLDIGRKEDYEKAVNYYNKNKNIF
jgi:NDP-sugar pyrophosphorylase family protein